jgi:hypothetical protein
MDPAPIRTHWRTLLGWSACAAMAAGMLMWAPLFCAALAAATGLGGVFFVTRIDHWTWTEPCAS